MKRNHTITNLNPGTQKELLRQIAYHEAGHAVAIYLRNKQCQLPPVFFQIILYPLVDQLPTENHLAKVEGGRLIQYMPLTLEHLSMPDQLATIAAYEADIINILVGPLAEAKYVALRDDEPMNQHLVNLQALGAYGGFCDLKIAHEYLQCFVQTLKQRDEKIEQLFLEAYRFIEKKSHWKIIKTVATHIIHSTSSCIPCEEIIQVIEHAISEDPAPSMLKQRPASLYQHLNA